jgi:hypothetical protein
MAQQTAVEWLQDQYDNCPESFLTDDDFKKAKAMEREQIIEAFDIGTNDENLIGKEYYNEIYTDSINASK